MIAKQTEDGSLVEISDSEYRDMLRDSLDTLLKRYVQSEEYEMAAACKKKIDEIADLPMETVKDAVTKLRVLIFITDM